MKPFIDMGNFITYLNQKHIVAKSTEITTVSASGTGFTAFLIMKSKQDYRENFTVEFVLKFEYKKNKQEGAVLQKEFKIEHHPEEKSRHTDPHVQLYIHGPAEGDKLGEMWINLPLKEEKEYIKCIEGFFYVLEDVIKKCEIGLEKELLDVEEIKKLLEPKKFLIGMIKHSLENKGIEYQNPKGEKMILKPGKLDRLLEKDQSLLPFFG